ncbi:MAG TPA: 1,4-alpha-glucan branching protein domain-containing protein [Solirubrobacteraceae bacterium]|nr:1,4-alpha-glucan branching protein domain-containing protein [Solirubrobacteraceae bacterium]
MSGRPGAAGRGELAIVLHTHMPYIEGFGTWPFGEEWLWEVIATSYLPLLDVLDAHPGAVTLSLTPVLADQLEAPGAMQRCLEFLRTVRPETHARDAAELRAAGQADQAREIERSAVAYAAAADRLAALQARPGGLLGALGGHVTWTSAATHAVLPLLAGDAGIDLQVQTGIAAHRRRFGAWGGGFWLPECGHAPWLDPRLEASGVKATCVELTGWLGAGHPAHRRPVATQDGPVLWPIDRAQMALVWSDGGYPARGPYRDSHRLTRYRHCAWSNAGDPYDHARAVAQAERDAEAFVAAAHARLHDGGVCVVALDTELLGHWWHEGVAWLGAVIAAARRRGLPLTPLDVAAERHPARPVPMPEAPTSWGEGGDLRTWSAPRVADLAFMLRTAELELAADVEPGPRARRELLALQASDWAFLAYRGTAGDYPHRRAAGHRSQLTRALAGDPELEPGLRGLAPDLAP